MRERMPGLRGLLVSSRRSSDRTLFWLLTTVSVLVAAAATVGSDVLFSSRFGSDALGWRLGLITPMLISWFVLVGSMSGSIAQTHRTWGIATWVACEAYLWVTCSLAYFRVHQALGDGLWTAAALQGAALPLRAIPGLLVAMASWAVYKTRP
jgi:hypothetical protein